MKKNRIKFSTLLTVVVACGLRFKKGKPNNTWKVLRFGGEQKNRILCRGKGKGNSQEKEAREEGT